MDRKIKGFAFLLIGLFLALCFFFWPKFAVSASLLDKFVGIKQLYILMLVVICIIIFLIGPIVATLILDTLFGYLNIRIHLFSAYLKLLSRLFHPASKLLPSKPMRLLYSFRNLIYGLGLAIVLMLIKGNDEIMYLWIASYLVMKGLDVFGVLKAIEDKLFKKKS